MNRFWKKLAVGLLMFSALALVMITSAEAAYSVKKQWVRTSATAGEALATGDVVCIKDSDGYAYEADANDSDLRPAIGIVGKGASSGGTVEIIVIGILDGWSSLSEGAAAYLSETASAVTQSAPSWNQQIGVALTSTRYFFNFGGAYLDASAVTSVGTLSGASPLIFEGASADAYETTMAVTDPTADNTITVPDDTGTICIVGGGEDLADGIWGTSAGDLVFEGNTADAYEMTFDISDPASDVSIVFPDYSGTIMLSTLATNEPDAANAVTGASNGLVFEGTTADAYESTIAATDPTADNTITLADGSGTVMLSILATNAPDAANAVTGASNSLVFEGATADAYESIIAPIDPTGDNTITLADSSGTVMLSSLETNAPDAANAVTGASNALVYEGTADDYETSLTATDATADRTITLADYSGAVPMIAQHGYTQTSIANSTADVTGSSITLEDGWFTEGKTLRFVVGGTVTGANAAVSVKLYFEDGAVMTLSTTDGAAGDWVAEFVIVGVTASTQRIVGSLIAEAGTELHCDYATDNTDTATAGTVPVKVQITSADAGDTITSEYVRVECWQKTD